MSSLEVINWLKTRCSWQIFLLHPWLHATTRATGRKVLTEHQWVLTLEFTLDLPRNKAKAAINKWRTYGNGGTIENGSLSKTDEKTKKDITEFLLSTCFRTMQRLSLCFSSARAMRQSGRTQAYSKDKFIRKIATTPSQSPRNMWKKHVMFS